MPATVDGATAYLQAFSATVKTDFVPGVTEFLRRFGKTTRLIPSSKRALNGNNMEFEFRGWRNRGTRATFDLMAPQADPGLGQYGRFNVVFDHTDDSLNDFIALEMTLHTTWWDMKKQSDSNIKQPGGFIAKEMQDAIDDIKETFARYIHLPSDGLLGTVATSGKRNDNTDTFTGASTYTTGADSCCLKLDETSIAKIGPGQKIEIRDTNGALRANHVKVTYVHPTEFAIHVAVTSDSVNASAASVVNCDTFAATDKIYLHGNYNVSPKGTLARLFDPTQAYYGKTRTGASGDIYKMLMPIRHDAGAGSSAVALTPDLLRVMGEAIGWTQGDGNALARRTVVSARDQYRAVSRFGKDEGMIFTPALESQVGQKFNKAFGFDGIVFHDPNFGSVMWTVDDFAAYAQIDFLNMDEWEMVSPFGDGGFNMLPGPIAEFWNRHTENDGSGRPSKRFSAQGIQTFAFVCKTPIEQCRLRGLTSPAA